VYNREKYIARAVNSVLAQTFSDWELLIVDDASTDKTREILQNYTDQRIQLIFNEENKERCVSRNIGIQQAKGKYIGFLDSDDYHLPDHLEKMYAFIQEKSEPEALFFSNAWDETPEGKRTPRVCPDFEKYNPFTYFLRYTVNPQRWFVHNHLFKKITFDPEITICEDMDTSLRMVASGIPVYQLKERTTVYVAAPDSFTHGASDKWERELSNLKKIIGRSELSGKLPKRETNRLLSMCHFHLALKSDALQKRGDFYSHACKSFRLFPAGYNGKTNKILFTISLYQLPVLGLIIKKLYRSLKWVLRKK
jgi:glycosyltransferase involved in cell wall biosynthesis